MNQVYRLDVMIYFFYNCTMHSQNISHLPIGYSTTGGTVFSYRFAVFPGYLKTIILATINE